MVNYNVGNKSHLNHKHTDAVKKIIGNETVKRFESVRSRIRHSVIKRGDNFMPRMEKKVSFGFIMLFGDESLKRYIVIRNIDWSNKVIAMSEYKSLPDVSKSLVNRRKKNNDIMKMKVFQHYSRGNPRCACCGEDMLDFLQIDHINGRKKYGHDRNFSGSALYRWIVKSGFPPDMQVLCANCNFAKSKKQCNGICPHMIFSKKSLGL